MSDWGWVLFAYATVYGAIMSYSLWTAWRTRRAATRLDSLT